MLLLTVFSSQSAAHPHHYQRFPVSFLFCVWLCKCSMYVYWPDMFDMVDFLLVGCLTPRGSATPPWVVA